MVEKEYAKDYTLPELLAVATAKELKDYERVFAGVGIPCLGALLAKYTTCPHLTIIVESGCIAPQPRRLILGIGDNACVERSISTTALWRVFSDQQRGLMDVGILSGAQIDKYGNLNSTAIFGDGDYQKPLARLPGSGGANDIASSAKRLVIMMRLERRRFLPRVDYITSPGYIKPGERERLRLRGGGPSAVITDKCIFRFDEKTKEMHLDSLHPGVKVEDIAKEVQWELKIAPEVKTSEPPTTKQVEILRTLDPLKIYLGEGLQTIDFPSYVKMLENSYEKLKSYISPFSI
jgi:glutaconate CoA-transferase subunit B